MSPYSTVVSSFESFYKGGRLKEYLSIDLRLGRRSPWHEQLAKLSEQSKRLLQVSWKK
jgi:hypothetical protein